MRAIADIDGQIDNYKQTDDTQKNADNVPTCGSTSALATKCLWKHSQRKHKSCEDVLFVGDSSSRGDVQKLDFPLRRIQIGIQIQI